jgi:hypothetical protein
VPNRSQSIVAVDGLKRLRAAMVEATKPHEQGSLEAITAAGVAYVRFAKGQLGVFRLMFGLKDGHKKSAELAETGRQTFGVVLQATADYLGEPVASPAVQETAYLLWTHVHGDAFLSIDAKRVHAPWQPNAWYYVARSCKSILDSHSV